ncbi:MAG: hypothetical protein NVS2B11_18260 [Acetobacteraceae bacterium]
MSLRSSLLLVPLALSIILTMPAAAQRETPTRLNINLFVPDGPTAIARANGALAAAGSLTLSDAALLLRRRGLAPQGGVERQRPPT